MFGYIRQLVKNTFIEAEASSADYQSKQKTVDKKTIQICCIVAFSVVGVRYFGDTTFVMQFIQGAGLDTLHYSFETLFYRSADASLYRLCWWVASIVGFYLVVPAIFIKFVWKEQMRAYGFKLRGAFKDYRMYFIMLAVMMPLVLWFSTTASFQLRYPFYKPIAGQPLFPKFVIWEFVYFFQFIAVEFFFRGFMVHGTKQRFGFYAVFVMMIPYCMVHFGKPLPETIAAIAAGIMLGILSLKSRSVILGIAIHYSVAISMDLFALWQLRH
ncbi:MAG TPA: CPBP family intramembrane metalloprotease [Bacteroidales bacterium]|nr:CPBP family intramembrane metalloprotease [Bacteroidales bacterium]